MFDEQIEQLRGKCGRKAKCADLIVALLEEINGNEYAMRQLTRDDGDYRNPTFTSKPIRGFIEAKYSIYRMRPLLSVATGFRVLYAYDLEYEDFYALGVVEKTREHNDTQEFGEEYDYQLTHPFTVGIFDQYDRFGLPHIP
jgi:hypothetical protein